ncbi:hypothetical protein TWF730_006944 [Orbilia blumenaviensis]|uniref:Uncharacterized protein n=1 Tax=Orbilia blumenaviensis TaxID=1796055 RepID=A0AAV9VFS8_9PEZI
MMFLLLAPLFGTLVSAFYVEVVSPSFPKLGPWQLCHNTRPAQEKYELTLWAIDISTTTCDLTGGDPHFQLVEYDIDKFALAGDKSAGWDAYETNVTNRGQKPVVMTESNLYVALAYKALPTGNDVVAMFEPRRYGSVIADDPVTGDVLKFVGGHRDSEVRLNPNELGLQIDLVQTDDGDVIGGELNPGRKSIFRTESNPDKDPNSPEVIFRISSPLRMYELGRDIEIARKADQKLSAFRPKEAVQNFFGGIKKSISEKVSNAKETVKDKIKSGLEKGLAKVMRNPRMHIHGLGENFEEEKEQEKDDEGDWEDQGDWVDRFGNNQDDHWESRLARFYGGGPTSNADNGKIKPNIVVTEESWEDIDEAQGGYYEGEGVDEPGVIREHYIDEIKVEKPKGIEAFEVEQGSKGKSAPGSNNNL